MGIVMIIGIFLMVTICDMLHIEGACINGSQCSKTGNDANGINMTRSEGGLLHRIEDVILGVEEEAGFLERLTGEAVQQECQCIHFSCGCCAHLEEKEIHLNSTICANVTYLSEDIGISLTVTVNKYTIYNETVSVRNPPPVCLGMPYIKEWAEACVRLYDIDATTSRLHACVRVEARMKKVLIAKYELGCFTLGPRVANEFIYNIVGNATESEYSVILV